MKTRSKRLRGQKGGTMTKPEYIQCCNTLIKYHRARPTNEASTQEEKDAFQRMVDYLKYKASNAASIHEPASERPMLQEQIETLYTRFNREAAADDASYITKLNIFSYQYVMLFTKVIQGADLTRMLKKEIKETYIPLLLTKIEEVKDKEDEMNGSDYERLVKRITDVDVDTMEITDIPSEIVHFIHYQLNQDPIRAVFDKLEAQGIDRELQILEAMINKYELTDEDYFKGRIGRAYSGERYGLNLSYNFRDCDYGDYILLLDIDIWAAKEMPYTVVKEKFTSNSRLIKLLNRGPDTKIYLTVALDELTLDDLLSYSFNQVFLCGIIYKNQFTDGLFMYPIEFLWHDIQHGNDFDIACNTERDIQDIDAFYAYCKRTIPDVNELNMITLMLFLEFHEHEYSGCNYTTDISDILGPGRNVYENRILKSVEKAFFRKTQYYGLIPPEFLDQGAPNNSVYRVQHGNFGRNLPRTAWNEGAIHGRIKNYLKHCIRHYFTKYIEWHRIKQDLGRNYSPNRPRSRSYSSPRNNTRKRGRART